MQTITRARTDMKDAEAFDFDGDYGRGYSWIAQTVIPGYDQLFREVLSLFLPRLGDDAHVLIVGCGTGKEIASLATANESWTFTAVDPSTAMIEASRGVARHLGVEDRVHLHHGYVHDLPEVPTFDAATVINVMHFLPDDGGKLQLLGSAAERMRPGAPVVLFDLHGDPESPEFGRLYEEWLEFMELRGLVGEEKERFVQRLEAGIVYVPRERIIDLSHEAGFEVRDRFFGAFLYGGWLLKKKALES
jgi:tRNA (cmo5U34)-methyltransferase